jgi:DNA polymerase III epsilon subunit-like protein
MSSLRTLFLDTETNGIMIDNKFSLQTLVQLSWINTQNVEHNYFINGATAISSHPSYPCKHITLQKLNNDGFPFDKIWPKLLTDITNTDMIVIHNSDFDMSILRYNLEHMIGPDELETFNALIRQKRVYCTMKNTTAYCKLPSRNSYHSFRKSYKWPKLSELYFVLFNEVFVGELHDSIVDCRVLQKCFRELVKRKVVVTPITKHFKRH